MCFKKPPKPPAPVDPGADPALVRERQQAELDNAAQKADNKQRRMEDQLNQLAGRIGRRSLFTGGQGGIGYPGLTRRFTGTGVAPNPSPGGGGVAPLPGGGGTGGVVTPSPYTRRALIGGGGGNSLFQQGRMVSK